MAVIEIMYHFKNERRGNARRTVLLKAERERERVGLVKLSADPVGCDNIGVGLHKLERTVAVELIEPHGVFGLEAVRGEELHQETHAGLAAERFGHVPRAARADTLDFGELLGAVGQDLQRMRAEAVHEHRRRRRADAAHRAGGEIFIDVLLPHRQRAHRRGRLELFAVARVALPHALDRQPLAGRGERQAAHDRHRLVAADVETENGVAVLLVLEDHAFYRSGEL